MGRWPTGAHEVKCGGRTIIVRIRWWDTQASAERKMQRAAEEVFEEAWAGYEGSQQERDDELTDAIEAAYARSQGVDPRAPGLRGLTHAERIRAIDGLAKANSILGGSQSDRELWAYVRSVAGKAPA